MTLNIALVGAGGMGMRHAVGYIELRKYFDDVNVVAVCDPHLESAHTVARAIAERTPETPKAFARLGDAVESADIALDAVDIVTSTPAHHALAIEAMRSGLHVMVEKPMGLTLAACRMMQSTEHEDRQNTLNIRKLPTRPDEPLGKGIDRCRSDRQALLRLGFLGW